MEENTLEYIPKSVILYALGEFRKSAEAGCTNEISSVVFKSVIDYIDKIKQAINMIPSINIPSDTIIKEGNKT